MRRCSIRCLAVKPLRMFCFRYKGLVTICHTCSYVDLADQVGSIVRGVCILVSTVKDCSPPFNYSIMVALKKDVFGETSRSITDM